MKRVLQIVIACYLIFRMGQCARNEWSEEHDRPTDHRVEKIEAPRPTQAPPFTSTDRIILDDSLERMYDKNYMDYDKHEHNMDDDDEWHDYFND
ncbi:hypothetical protein [Sphingobacterium lumbrici]|uniref:hypothetical protein n=1 Tax=Sphingobacterium lumbrici TaxID=2559600 RepID=UPI00112BA58B|nr:hypothetical protein [Sphingobacterium lumbrici]